MDKSFFFNTPRMQYALDHSTPLSKHVENLIKVSLEHPERIMIGARGVLQTCTAIIDMIQAKKILDIGLFTGVSALTWALAIPDDGKVISMDIEEETYNQFGKRIIQESGVAHKIDIRIQPGLQTLQELIDAGLSGTFDFVFLDADKTNYPNYLNLCLPLLRTGGVLAADNAIFEERVLEEEKDVYTAGIDKLNKLASTNPNVRSVLLPFEDGLHLIVKKS